MNLCLRISCLLLAVASHATTIPATQGIALDGHSVMLPRDLAGRATILILGFTQHSSDNTTAWQKSVGASLANGPTINYFNIPFLQAAPSFIRPLIVRSIRKQVPDDIKPRFVPLTAGEDLWKQISGFTPADADAAYVLLVDRSGNILWQTHEAFSQARFNELATAAHKLADAR